MTSFFKLMRTIIVIGLVLAVVSAAAIYSYMEYGLQNTEELNTVQLQVPLQIYTHDGLLLAAFGEKKRIPIPFSQIPKPLIQAVLATEDQRFFTHPGVDVPGLFRAFLRLILTGRKLEGGSTITMQVARSFYLNPRKTIGRKLREILLAIKIESRLSKQKILELYLNKVFFGNRAYGVEAAAEVYFGKHLQDLSIDELALIAGLPQAPSVLNPIANPEAAKKRRNHVLARMLEMGDITQKTYENAIAAPINASYHDLQTELKAPYVAEVAREQLHKMYGDDIYTSGYKIYTTIDSHLQNTAANVLREQLLNYDQRHGYRGAEKNLGSPTLENLDEMTKQLNAIPAAGGLEPAVVFEINTNTITALRTNGELATLDWSALSWARKQINPDYLGDKPKRADQILKLGDVIRLQKTGNTFKLAQIPKAEAAFIALNSQNGAIIAMVGGFDYQQLQFNRVISADRQPGSSFKPFIYSAALEKGYTLATIINDAPIVVENPYDHSLWRPQNDFRKFYGPTRIREALIHSVNTVSIRLLDLAGLEYTSKHLRRFGFRPESLPPGLAMALGAGLARPIEMAAAYAVFANGGFLVSPYIIDYIKDSQQKIVYSAKPSKACAACNIDPNQKSPPGIAPRAISAENAFLITSALRDVILHGTASAARDLQRNDLAGKTGTTNNQVDAWFAGYHKEITAVAWVGFDKNQQSLHEHGSKAALPIWIQFMQEALKNKPDEGLTPPKGIVRLSVDPRIGKLTDDTNPMAIHEYFMTPFLPVKDRHTDLNEPDENEKPLF